MTMPNVLSVISANLSARRRRSKTDVDPCEDISDPEDASWEWGRPVGPPAQPVPSSHAAVPPGTAEADIQVQDAGDSRFTGRVEYFDLFCEASESAATDISQSSRFAPSIKEIA